MEIWKIKITQDLLSLETGKLLKTESQIKYLFEKHLYDLLNYRVVELEYKVPYLEYDNKKGFIDTLAWDDINEQISLIEYKNRKNEEIFDQVRTYIIMCKEKQNLKDLHEKVEAKLSIPKEKISKAKIKIDLFVPMLTTRQQIIYFKKDEMFSDSMDLYLLHVEDEYLYIDKILTKLEFDKIFHLTKKFNSKLLNTSSSGKISFDTFIELSFKGTKENIKDKLNQIEYFINNLQKLDSRFTFDFWNGARKHIFVQFDNITVGNINPFEFKEHLSFVWHIKETREKAFLLDKGIWKLYKKGVNNKLHFRTDLKEFSDSDYVIDLLKRIVISNE